MFRLRVRMHWARWIFKGQFKVTCAIVLINSIYWGWDNRSEQTARNGRRRWWDEFGRISSYCILYHSCCFHTAYSARDDVYKSRWNVFTLPFLPVDQVTQFFTNERNIAQLTTILQNVNEIWFSNKVWTVPSWGVLGLPVRTKNADVMGRHHNANLFAMKENV